MDSNENPNRPLEPPDFPEPEPFDLEPVPDRVLPLPTPVDENPELTRAAVAAAYHLRYGDNDLACEALEGLTDAEVEQVRSALHFKVFDPLSDRELVEARSG